MSLKKKPLSAVQKTAKKESLKEEKAHDQAFNIFYHVHQDCPSKGFG